MAHRKLNSVRQIVTGTSTGALALGAATSSKYKTLQAAGLADGDTTYVRIQHETIDAEWECVKITRSGTNINRLFDAKSDSATGSALINFSAGNKIVTSSLLAGQVVAEDPNGDVTITRNLLVGGSVSGNVTSFTAALQSAWDNDTVLNWVGGDVTLSAPIVLQAPTGKAAFGLNGNGMKITCSFNDATKYALTFEIPVVSGSVVQGIAVRNWQVQGVKFQALTAFAGGIQVRCLSNGSWFYSFLLSDCSCDGHSDYAYWWNGSVFECIGNRLKSTGGKGGMRITRADNALNGDFGLPSAMELLSPNFRDFGFGALGIGNGIEMDCRTAFTEPFDLSIKGGYIVTGAGMAVNAPAGITMIDNLGIENMDGGWGMLLGYRGGLIKGLTRGANPIAGATTSPPNGMRYLLEWWGASGFLVMEDLQYENEVSGSGMTLAKVSGSGTVYMNRSGPTAGVDNSGCTIVNTTP